MNLSTVSTRVQGSWDMSVHLSTRERGQWTSGQVSTDR